MTWPNLANHNLNGPNKNSTVLTWPKISSPDLTLPKLTYTDQKGLNREKHVKT